MGEEKPDFNSEFEEFGYQQYFCDCCYCQEAEEEYHQEREREYQMDLLEEDMSTAD